MKKYWFYLESFIYTSCKNDWLLVYNTKTGRYVEKKDACLVKLVKEMYNDENVGVIDLTEIDMNKPNISSFVEEITTLGMGNLIEVQSGIEKPIILYPLLALNHDYDKLNEEEADDGMRIFLSTNIGSYLLQTTIFLNGKCNGTCKHCGEYNTQMICCSKHEEELAKEDLQNLISQLLEMPVPTINVCGGNIYKYPYIKEICDQLGNTGKKLNFYVNYQNYCHDACVDCYNLHIIIEPDFDMTKLESVISETSSLNVKFHFVIENEFQYENAMNVVTNNGGMQYTMFPFYTGNNKVFFEKNVFYSKEDIMQNIHSKREIFRNQKMNANVFGHLYILSDGTVKAGLNSKPIGNIRNEKIIYLIDKELNNNTSWRIVRDFDKCAECVFQYLCPPLSNYEKVFAKTNMCSVMDTSINLNN